MERGIKDGDKESVIGGTVHPGGLLRAVRAHAVGMRAQWWFAPRQREKEVWGPECDEPPLTSDTSRGFVCT